MKIRTLVLVACVLAAQFSQHSLATPIAISGYLANPAGTDSPFEYVQLVATQNIDFATTNYSVVWCNNGTATSNGWVAGSALSYGFNLTSGIVSAGDVFYVGGDGKLINGASTASLAAQTWIRAINTGTTGGDGFGTAASAGVMGNGGSNADGIGVFTGLVGSLTSASVPLDAVFYGSGVGSAKPASGGYTLPDNDHYTNAGGVFGSTGNDFMFGDPASAAYTKLTGTYDTSTNTWTSARIGSFVSSPAAVGDIASAITLVPEPSAMVLAGIGAVLAAQVCRRRRHKS